MTDQMRSPENTTMMQGFEWCVHADHRHWIRLQRHIPHLKHWGIDNIWLPPGCKGSSPWDNGYAAYDLYDLGEFDQKGTVATKWGTRADLHALCDTATRHGVGLYWDAILNHKSAADREERCPAVEVDPDDRNRFVTDKYDITAWVGFDFPGRGDTYSSMKYHWYHFSGVDFNAENGKTAIYKIMGDQSPGWASVPDVNSEKGNFDYLMGSDLDYSHPEVEGDMLHWGRWIAHEIPLRGMRFDAVKHFSTNFLRKFIGQFDEEFGPGWFFVGRMDKKFSLFDVPLIYSFCNISHGDGADLRRVFDNTLVQAEPVNAVTIVTNHDTQPYQAISVSVEDWFKPLAYALILLRSEGYPCVFFGDLYGVKGDHETPPACGGNLPKLVLARKLYAYGRQADYFDYPTCIGWVRYGTWDRPYGCAIVLSNAGAGWKRMHVGEIHAGEVWTDVLGWNSAQIRIGEDGFADFPCGQCSLGVWVNNEAAGRGQFLEEFDSDIYAERDHEERPDQDHQEPDDDSADQLTIQAQEADETSDAEEGMFELLKRACSWTLDVPRRIGQVFHPGKRRRSHAGSEGSIVFA